MCRALHGPESAPAGERSPSDVSLPWSNTCPGKVIALLISFGPSHRRAASQRPSVSPTATSSASVLPTSSGARADLLVDTLEARPERRVGLRAELRTELR